MREGGTAELRRRAEALLRVDDFEARLSAWLELPGRRAVNALFSFLCSAEELLRWRAVRAMGVVVSRLAETDVEAARIVLRRLMWSLAEESGGFGWGAPEAMGEIMAMHEGLAREYAHILASYVREDGNRLDNDLLLRGAIWGLGRLAQVRPRSIADCAEHLEPFLGSPDAALRGLAAWALRQLGASARAPGLLNDEAEFSLYDGGVLSTRRVCDVAASLAGEAIPRP